MKKLSFRVSIIQALIYIFKIKYCFTQLATGQKPKIDILGWLEIDDHLWKTGPELDLEGVKINETTFFIPGDILVVVLSCKANYPIEWKFIPDEHLSTTKMLTSYSVTQHREKIDESTEEFSMNLAIFALSNIMTGRYSCESIQNPDLVSVSYIFWEGNSPPYLIGAGTTVDVSSFQKTNVRLPCLLSSPDPETFLQIYEDISTPSADMVLENTTINIIKEDTNSSLKNNNTIIKNETTIDVNRKLVRKDFVDINNSSGKYKVRYDKTIGYIIELSHPSSDNYQINDTFKCLTGESDDDFLIVNVVPKPVNNNETTEIRNEFIDNGAKFYFNETSSYAVCCSNTKTLPSFLFIRCSNYVHCDLSKPFLYRKAFYLQFFDRIPQANLKDKENNCHYININLLHEMGGVFRCFGDGIETSQTVFSSHKYFTNGSSAVALYKSWSDVNNPKELIKMSLTVLNSDHMYNAHHLTVDNDPFSAQFYSGQKAHVHCSASPFYFTEEVKIVASFKNDTNVDFLKQKSAPSYYYYFSSNPQTSASFEITKEMLAITCEALVWNSTARIQNTKFLNIMDPIAPEIEPNDSPYYWTLNETQMSIECIGFSDPFPKFHWLKDGEPFDSSYDNFKGQHVSEETTNTSSKLTFSIVDYSTHGDYVCIAQNFANSSQMIFKIIVEEARSWKTITVITVSILLLLTILGILLWKLKIKCETDYNW